MSDTCLIRPLTAFTLGDLHRLIVGYWTNARYVVTKFESAETITIQLQLVTLDSPRRKQYDPIDDETLQRYTQVAQAGFSFGAYDEEQLIGLALAEPHEWNKSLWVWEFHVAETHQRRGLGRRLMEALADKATAAGLRIIVCETQNTNMPAINFYWAVGFAIEGVDVSYYTNDDLLPDREVAVFMKRRLDAR